MSYQPVAGLLPKAAGSVYKLVILASQRALELAEGMPRLVEQPKSDKLTVLALSEIAGEQVGLRIKELKEKPKETKKEAKKEAKKETKKEAKNIVSKKVLQKI